MVSSVTVLRLSSPVATVPLKRFGMPEEIAKACDMANTKVTESDTQEER